MDRRVTTAPPLGPVCYFFLPPCIIARTADAVNKMIDITRQNVVKQQQKQLASIAVGSFWLPKSWAQTEFLLPTRAVSVSSAVRFVSSMGRSSSFLPPQNADESFENEAGS